MPNVDDNPRQKVNGIIKIENSNLFKIDLTFTVTSDFWFTDEKRCQLMAIDDVWSAERHPSTWPPNRGRFQNLVFPFASNPMHRKLFRPPRILKLCSARVVAICDSNPLLHLGIWLGPFLIRVFSILFWIMEIPCGGPHQLRQSRAILWQGGYRNNFFESLPSDDMKCEFSDLLFWRCAAKIMIYESSTFCCT